MPYYDYKCKECGKKFEVKHGMNEKPTGLKCEFCGAENVLRVFTSFGRCSCGGSGSEKSSHSCSSCSCSSGGCGGHC
ncbi:MAG: zinc ribbon domain-containing protein [Candidatus Margulisiibacteriota bacterium]